MKEAAVDKGNCKECSSTLFAVIHFHIRSIGAFLQRTKDEWLHNTHKGQDLIFN